MANFVPFDPSAQADTDAAYAYSSIWDVMKEKGFAVRRFLPPHPNMAGRVWVPAVEHFVPDTGEGRGGTVVCPAQQDRQNRRPCPVCDMVARLPGFGVSTEDAKRHGARTRYLANVIQLELTEDGQGFRAASGPLILGMSNYLKNLIWDSQAKPQNGIAVKDRLRPELGIHNFPDPVMGRNVLITKHAANPWWEVKWYPDQEHPLLAIQDIGGAGGEEGVANVLEGLHDVTQQIVVRPHEEMLNIASLMEQYYLKGSQGGGQRQAPRQANPAIAGPGVSGAGLPPIGGAFK